MKMKTNKGFSLVELIVVIAIMAIIAAVAVPVYNIYIEKTEKANDKKLVSDVLYALSLASETDFTADGQSAFLVGGQYSQGIAIPVGFVVISDEVITTTNAGNISVSGTMISISNNAEGDPIHDALVAAFGSDYNTAIKLTHDGWVINTVGSSSFHNASAGMMKKINDVGDVMTSLNGVLDLTSGDYADTDEMIIAVAKIIADYNKDEKLNTPEDKEAFVKAWAGVTDQPVDQVSFGLSERECYSAVRMAYNAAFAEYVRANYNGADKDDIDDIVNNIANYGQTAGELAYEKVKETSVYKTAWETTYKTMKWMGEEKAKAAADKACEYIIKEAVDAVANVDTKFPYTANRQAFNDPNYAGYNNDEILRLYDKWIEGQDEKDAAMFYDTMVTVATEGENYDGDNFALWFKEQAENYSQNFTKIETLVKDKSAIVIAVFYRDGVLNCEVYSTEADPRN